MRPQKRRNVCGKKTFPPRRNTRDAPQQRPTSTSEGHAMPSLVQEMGTPPVDRAKESLNMLCAMRPQGLMMWPSASTAKGSQSS